MFLQERLSGNMFGFCDYCMCEFLQFAFYNSVHVLYLIVRLYLKLCTLCLFCLQFRLTVLFQSPVHWSIKKTAVLSVIRNVMLIQTKFHCTNLTVS